MTIFKWLKENNQKAKQLAAAADLSAAQVSRILNGQSCPHWKTASRLSNATNGQFSATYFVQLGAGVDPENDDLSP
ncbi:MAG: helix-turn-helix domain-containing protein [Roseibium sp.]|uniref:helix-turn-helix domain-containing protein n=1 Tax=Roseibium sp. TaxID=1936156 RepID=UPI0026101942|nr:helix-turn-helix domain-containing protein [Roseibium sp.]MCV0429283.1 helix-turn-helix domain-containing protein [Roseibium sp.]